MANAGVNSLSGQDGKGEVVTLDAVHYLEALLPRRLPLPLCDRLIGFLDAMSAICYVVGGKVRVPAVQDPRETSRSRIGDTQAGRGFFMTVRSCAAALF